MWRVVAQTSRNSARPILLELLPPLSSSSTSICGSAAAALGVVFSDLFVKTRGNSCDLI